MLGLFVAFLSADLFAAAPAPSIVSQLTASGQVGVVFSYTIKANRNPATFSAINLPAGLSVNTATGVISGTPTTAGNSSVTIGATNSSGTGAAVLTLTINPPTPIITSVTTASGEIGVTFNYQITASNSPTSYSTSTLPNGLSVNTATGVISGAPTSASTNNVTISATNTGGTGTAILTLTITVAKPVISSATSATGQVGAVFNYQITASNSPTSYSASGLPAGLGFNSATGVIAGTPTASGTSSVSIGASNAGGTGTATLTLSVNPATSPPIPVITSASSASGQVGLPFVYQITASNNPTSYSASSLPGELEIDSNSGMITGTPTVVGTSSVAIHATNADGTGSATLLLTILASLPYTTDFELGEGHIIGSLNGQLGWSVSQGAALVTGSDYFSGASSARLAPSSPATIIAQPFAPVMGAEVIFGDFFAKPVAQPSAAQATSFTIERTKFAFQESAGQGVLYSFSGDGAGGASWFPTSFSIPLGADNRPLSWTRLTARLDFPSQTWDLYANGQMVAADLKFFSSGSTSPTTFQVQGDSITASSLDDLYVGANNPLFADINNDGIDDAWETMHGLSLATDNRDLSPTGNGITVVQAYVAGTNPNDYYNGAIPLLTIIGGNDQSDTAGEFNPLPFDIGVWDSTGTTPWIDAPVTFSVIQGGGSLATTNTGSPTLYSNITVRTDSDGTAQLYYKQPPTVGILSQISVSAGTATPLVLQSESSSGADSDSDGLNDAWELQYFGTLSYDPADDPGSVGRTLLQSFQQTLNPWPDATVVEGLRAWYRAEEGVAKVADDKVSQWTDISGGSHHISQSVVEERPTWVASAINGHAAIAFTPASTLNTADPMDLLEDSQDITIIALIRPAAPLSSGASIFAFGIDGAPRDGLIADSPAEYCLHWHDGIGQSMRSPFVTVGVGEPELLTVLKSGTSAQTYRNGTLAGATTVTSTIASSIGRLAVGEWFNGDIAEILVYYRALTETERVQAESGLATRYGLPPITVPDADGDGLSDAEEDFLGTDKNQPDHPDVELEVVLPVPREIAL